MGHEDRDWISRLKSGLSRSSGKLSGGISDLFTKQKLDQATLDGLEEILITADLGIGTASKLSQTISEQKFDKKISVEDVRSILADEIGKILEPVALPLIVDPTQKPFVVLFCGVNGSGKTTTIGKLANQFRSKGKSVILAAGDTFRAAAVEQLNVWGERANALVVAGNPGTDAASLAYGALERAMAEEVDILLIDTAGRLQNRKDLMAELEKIVRVLKKLDDSAPHATLLVMDATIGQNAHSQVQTFKTTVDISGLVITKLDGSAKGGVVIALAEKFGLPIHAVGVGENIQDLRTFGAKQFARSLMGLEP
mgnify:FL=1